MGRKNQTSKIPCCSFCRKSEDVVGKLIANPGDYERAYICDECVAVCHFILDDDHGAGKAQPEALVPEGLQVAGAYHSESEALQVQAALEAAGIPAHVTWATGCLVLVHKEDLEDALAYFDRGAPDERAAGGETDPHKSLP